MKLKVEEKKESSSMRFTLKLDQELRSCFPAWGKGSLRGTSQGASILLIFRRPSLQAVPSPSLMVPLSSWWHVFFGCTEPYTVLWIGFYVDISWESRCYGEIKVWGHLCQILVVLKSLLDPKWKECLEIAKTTKIWQRILKVCFFF